MWARWLASVALLVHAASCQQPQGAENSSYLIGQMPRESCENARLRCAYRTGCGEALSKYAMSCTFILDSQPHSLKYCPEPCQHALIALTSTEEGKSLMNCRCSDASCEAQKRRVEVCRPQVEEAIEEMSVVSCQVAEWICDADPVCTTALSYYHRLCKAMFQGKKCNHRCNNSLSILLRQEKAAKLATCVCNGRENYNCQRMRDNMSRLCQLKLPTLLPPASVDTNEVVPSAAPPSTLAPSTALLLLLLARFLLAHIT